MDALEPKTHHIWLPDGRSLCDRRALPPNSPLTSAEERDAHLAEQQQAPACSSCLVLVGRLRREACAILEMTQGRVHPDDPREAWGQLHSTRWEWFVALDAFLERDDLASIRFDAVKYAVDEESVNQLVAEYCARRDRIQGLTFDEEPTKH